MNYVSELNSIIEQDLMINHLDGGEKLKSLLDTAVKLYNVVNSILIYKSNSNDNIILPDEMILLRNNILRLKNELGLNEEKEKNAITR